jgi:hypothetical protein
MARVQNFAVPWITGGLPIGAMELASGIPPPRLRCNLLLAGYAAHIMTLPDSQTTTCYERGRQNHSHSAYATLRPSGAPATCLAITHSHVSRPWRPATNNSWNFSRPTAGRKGRRQLRRPHVIHQPEHAQEGNRRISGVDSGIQGMDHGNGK